MTEILHYFGLICLAASLLMRILPAPSEISWKPYAVLYGIIRCASLNLPSPDPLGPDPKIDPKKG
jgi:hypothetical protein